MSKMKYFPAFLSLRPILMRLSLDEVGGIFLGALQYADDGTVPDLDPTPSIVFEFIRQDIDRAQESYDKRCELNRENIMKRWYTTEYDGIPEYTSEYDGIPSYTTDTNANANAIAKEKKKENEFSAHASGESLNSRQIGPSRAEVRRFVMTEGLNVDADDYWEKRRINGWRNKRGRFVGDEWQRDVRTWAKYQKNQVPKAHESAPAEKPVEDPSSSYDTDEFFGASVKAAYKKYGFEADETEES